MFESLRIPFWKEVGVLIVGLLAVYLSPVGQSSLCFGAVCLLAVGLVAVYISVFGRYALFLSTVGLLAVSQSAVGFSAVGLVAVILSVVYLGIVGLLAVYIHVLLVLERGREMVKKKDETGPEKQLSTQHAHCFKQEEINNPNRQIYNPNNGNPKNGNPNNGDPNNVDPNNGDPNNGNPKNVDPNNGNPNNGDHNNGNPNNGNPNNVDPDNGNLNNGNNPNNGNPNMQAEHRKKIIIVYDEETGRTKEFADTLRKEATDLGYNITAFSHIRDYGVGILIQQIQGDVLVVMFMKTKIGDYLDGDIPKFCTWLQSLPPYANLQQLLEGLYIAVFNLGGDPKKMIQDIIYDKLGLAAHSITCIGNGENSSLKEETTCLDRPVFVSFPSGLLIQSMILEPLVEYLLGFKKRVACIKCIGKQPVSDVREICCGDHIIFHRYLYDHHAIVIDTNLTAETQDTKKGEFRLAQATFTGRSWFSFLKWKPSLSRTLELIEIKPFKVSKCFHKRQYVQLLLSIFFKARPAYQHHLLEHWSPTLTVVVANNLVNKKPSHRLEENCEHFATFCASGGFVSFRASKFDIILQILFPIDKGLRYLMQSPLILMSELMGGVPTFEGMVNKRLHKAHLMCEDCYTHLR